jgi:hypothetical protein
MNRRRGRSGRRRSATGRSEEARTGIAEWGMGLISDRRGPHSPLDVPHSEKCPRGLSREDFNRCTGHAPRPAPRSWTALHDATTLKRPASAAELTATEQNSSRRKRKGFLRDCVVVSIGPFHEVDVRPFSLFPPSMDRRLRRRCTPYRLPAFSGHDRPLLDGARQRRRSHVRHG